MAGDWIKMRTDLALDPAVIAIAAELEMDEFAVVGRLHALWSWADAHTLDGCCANVARVWIDRYVRAHNFCNALCAVGWLSEDERGRIVLPKFDRHNGKSAKRRALAKEHMRQKRCADVALPAQQNANQRREEKSIDLLGVPSKSNAKRAAPLCVDDVTIPGELATPEVAAALAEWLAYKRKRRQAYKTADSVVRLLQQFAPQGPAAFVEAVNHSIAQNYAGCFSPKTPAAAPTQRAGFDLSELGD